MHTGKGYQKRAYAPPLSLPKDVAAGTGLLGLTEEVAVRRELADLDMLEASLTARRAELREHAHALAKERTDACAECRVLGSRYLAPGSLAKERTDGCVRRV